MYATGLTVVVCSRCKEDAGIDLNKRKERRTVYRDNQSAGVMMIGN